MTSPAVRVEIKEVQSPGTARKSSEFRNLRPIDPPPVAYLQFTQGDRVINYQQSGYQYIHMTCTADLYRVPENLQGPEAGPTAGWTYYAQEGPEHDPVYVLKRTHEPSRLRVIGHVGNHLLLPDSEESHLLTGSTNTVAAHRDGASLCFVFPNIGVLTTGKYVFLYNVYPTRDSYAVAKCIGSTFDVVPAGQFAGQPPSTPLTDHLARQDIPGLRMRQ
ncbi:hypothetical protein C8R43DRAFT_942100 [Mycena crocata]|nr:hypothetical protein C8R43DRAFT_942100 [Mycena crocata]